MDVESLSCALTVLYSIIIYNGMVGQSIASILYIYDLGGIFTSALHTSVNMSPAALGCIYWL